MKPCNAAPIRAAGMNATTTPITKRRASGSKGRARAMAQSFPKYTERMARIAPSWISTSKVWPEDSKPRKWATRRRCPVEETGRNSVSPSINPRNRASIRCIIVLDRPLARLFQPNLRRARLVEGLRRKRHSPANGEWNSYRLLTNLSLIVAPRFASEALMITLHHYAFCPHSRFIRLVLAEMGMQPDAQEERPWERRVPFLELNPAGTIPVLVDEGGLVVPGASVIAEYLDETPRARSRRPPPVAAGFGGADRGAPAARLVPGEVSRGGDRTISSRKRSISGS